MAQNKVTNPEHMAQTIMTKSFLHARGFYFFILESLRERGTGSDFFHDNRIRSCSYIREDKGGYKAVPFYDKRNNTTYPSDSTFRKSWNSTVHSNRKSEYAGGITKTLTAVLLIKLSTILKHQET